MTIKTYQGTHKEQIASLIINIQRGEFNVPITLADQPDLANIPSFYQVKNGEFWVAENDVGKVVGTIALIDIGGNEGAIRKMFVHKDYRGKEKGVGQLLLDTLIDWCKQKSITEIYLGTVAQLHAAKRFYVKNGFEKLDKKALPENFPLMQVDTEFFKLVLNR